MVELQLVGQFQILKFDFQKFDVILYDILISEVNNERNVFLYNMIYRNLFILIQKISTSIFTK